MYIRTKKVKGNEYFYLSCTQRVEGKPHPIQKTIAYLGNREQALAALEAMDIPEKFHLIDQVQKLVLAKVI